jgi:hypothetical protein
VDPQKAKLAAALFGGGGGGGGTATPFAARAARAAATAHTPPGSGRGGAGGFDFLGDLSAPAPAVQQQQQQPRASDPFAVLASLTGPTPPAASSAFSFDSLLGPSPPATVGSAAPPSDVFGLMSLGDGAHASAPQGGGAGGILPAGMAGLQTQFARLQPAVPAPLAGNGVAKGAAAPDPFANLFA